MKKWQQAAVLLLAAALFCVCFTYLGRALPFTSPFFVSLMAFTFLGLVAVARPVITLRLPRYLRVVRPWETRGKLYRKLGVPIYGTVLRRSPLRYLNSTVYLGSHKPNFPAVRSQMEAAEAAHLLDITLTVPYLFYAWSQNWWTALLWLTIFHLGVNVYPILHLRWTRGRLERITSKKFPQSTSNAAYSDYGVRTR